MLLIELLPIAVFAISYLRDPRKVRTAIYLLVALLGALFVVVIWLARLLSQVNEYAGAFSLLVVIVLGLATVLGFAGFLVVAGVTLLRREGYALSHILGLAAGLALFGYAGLAVVVAFTGSIGLFAWLFLLGVPAGYLGFVFTAYLLYGSLYPALMARSGRPVDAVVVLGSGLIDGQVPPLLASRLHRGREVFDRLAERGTPARVLVTSGGRGPDEPVAEGEAMAAYLVADGMPADLVLVEDESRNTDENLGNTAGMLAAQGITGPIAVVTSDFHAFRAALLMRKHGLAGYGIGSPTARYYWPSAVIREFFAVLRDHLWLNAVLLALCTVPLAVYLLTMLFAQR